MRRMTFSELKTFVARWPRGLVVLAGLVCAGLLVLWLLGQVALGGQVTLVQIITALLVLTGLYWTSRRVVAAEEGHITDRFTKAIAHLGADNMAIRLGGIYALERIAKESEKDHGPIMEVLTAYVRENAPTREEDTHAAPKRPPTDIQAILTVIGRRETTGKNRGNDRLDLTDTRLVGAALSGATLSGATLSGANLTGADLGAADLSGADLSGADLTGADLGGADLTGATLGAANLDRAILDAANLDRAILDARIFGGAKNLTAAQVQRASNWRKATLPDYLKDLKDLPDPPA